MAHPDDYCPEELLLPIDEEMKDRGERWAVQLQGYHFTVKYLEGEKSIIADYLSRDGRTRCR